MKIFFLASSFPEESNRMRGIFNYRFIKQMNELGEDVFVVFFRMWSPRRKVISSYLYNEIKVTQVCLPLIPSGSLFFLKVNNFICRFFGWLLLKKELTLSDVIHSVSLTTNGIIAGKWANKLHIPHISQAIGSDVNSDMIRMSKKIYKWMNNIDGIITNSSDLERSIKKYWSADKPEIKTIYRGTEIFEFQTYMDCKNEEVAFLYLGGLGLNKSLIFGINTKGGITLMEAWRKAENQLYQLNCVLYFGGLSSDCNTFTKWKNTLKYPEKVKLVGKVSPNDVISLLNKVDVTVIPSMQEGLPNFLMESAANKRAVIGSNAGGIPEVISHGKTGLIFEKGNVQQLADLLIRAATNREDNIKMGEAAYNRVKADFNANNYSNNIINFYNKIIKKYGE